MLSLTHLSVSLSCLHPTDNKPRSLSSLRVTPIPKLDFPSPPSSCRPLPRSTWMFWMFVFFQMTRYFVRTLSFVFVPREGGVKWEVSSAARSSRVSGWCRVPARAICTVGTAPLLLQHVKSVARCICKFSHTDESTRASTCVCSRWTLQKVPTSAWHVRSIRPPIPWERDCVAYE